MKMQRAGSPNSDRHGRPDLRQAVSTLEHIGAPGRSLKVIHVAPLSDDPGHALLQVETPDGGRHHVLAYLSTVGEPRYVDQLAGALTRHRGSQAGLRALFVARSVGPVARRRCQELDLHYLALTDRSYHISLGGYHYEREGSRPPSRLRRAEGGLVTKARLRVIRALLCNPREEWDQIVLAQRAQVSVATVNGLVNQLADRKYGERLGRGPKQKFRLTAARELLEEWAAYWPQVTRARHRYYARYSSVERFAARLSRIAREIHDAEVAAHRTRRLWETPSTKPPGWQQALDRGLMGRIEPLALTGLAAAAFVEDFVRFTVIEAYTSVDLTRLAEQAELRAVEDEPNVVLMEPPDYGILTETRKTSGAPIVCPAQLYVDLMAAGGRAAGEAAPRIRADVLGEAGRL